jgi:hypothetical protein
LDIFEVESLFYGKFGTRNVMIIICLEVALWVSSISKAAASGQQASAVSLSR